MEKQEIYQRILKLAQELVNENDTFTRADLADELSDMGVGQDSIAISELVWDAYQHFGHDNAIKKAFLENDHKRPIVESYQIDALIEEGDHDALFPALQRELDSGGKALNQLERSMGRATPTAGGGTANKLLNTIVGTKGVVDVRDEATDVFNGYSQMVGCYEEAKSRITYLIADFVKLRELVCQTYWKYAIVLTDAFGDSVKAISPELFDFDTIEWLDVQGMLQRVQLDYNKLTEKCATLMSDIQDSFSQSLQRASASANGSNKLLMAALAMTSHYLDASSKAMELKQDLVVLKNSVKHDTTVIKGDLYRLATIYKSLNDLYIPQSEAFCRFSEQVLKGEWKAVEDALYADEEIKRLKQQRDETLEELGLVERDMSDCETNIGYYTAHVEDCRQLLESLRPQYEEAKQSKPSKPFFLANIFSLGAANRNYNRNLYEWDSACRPVISRYEGLQVDVKLDSDELRQQQEALAANQKEQKELRMQLDKQNKIIMQKIQVSPATRKMILPHLEAIVKLLRMARQIANSKLDEKLTHTVSVTKQDTELPEELRQNIRVFAQGVSDFAQAVYGDLQGELAEERELVESQLQANEHIAEEQRQMEIQQVRREYEDEALCTQAEGEAVQSAIRSVEAWMNLKAMEAKSAEASAKYDDELGKLQASFREAMSKIDNKSAVMLESLRRMNTAQDAQQLKEGLMALAGNDKQIFSDKDWDDFLNGQKTIEL